MPAASRGGGSAEGIPGGAGQKGRHRKGDGKLTGGTAAQARAANPTDPHSRIMKGQHGYLQGYNAQAVVTEDLIIVAAGLTDQPADSRQLHPMLKETKTNLAAIRVEPGVGVLVADSGYYSEANLAEATEQDPELLIAMTNDHDQRRGVARGRGFGKGRYGDEMRARLTGERGREIYGKRRQWSSLYSARSSAPGRPIGSCDGDCRRASQSGSSSAPPTTCSSCGDARKRGVKVRFKSFDQVAPSPSPLEQGLSATPSSPSKDNEATHPK